MNDPYNNKLPDPHRWAVFAALCLVYFFVYFHRVSTSVIVNDLLAAFHTDATALGFMSSMYFYLYAFEQPLVGYLADRIGPRRVVGYWSVVAAAGCLMFGLAPTIGWASAGRALIGIGVGGVYVPALKALSIWFRPMMFSTMLGWFMAVGNLGAVIATTPLAWAADRWGWRPTFFLIGGITIALAFFTLLKTRDHHSLSESRTAKPLKETPQPNRSRSNAMRVLANGQFWVVGLIFFGFYGTILTLQGLWATPFLMSVFGIERIFASKLNMLIPVGVIIGAPLLGWLNDRFHFNKKQVLIGLLVLNTAMWGAITFSPASLGIIGISLVLLGLGTATGGFISTLWGIVRDTTSAEIFGLTTGFLNPAPFFGVAAFQLITGAILDRTGRVNEVYPASGFENAFLTCFISALICLALAFLIKAPRRWAT